MTSAFQRAWLDTKRLEGWHSNDPEDPGGPTTFGITEDTARKFGYSRPMTELTEEEARLIAYQGYWDAYGIEWIARVNEPVARFVFDLFFNHSPATATGIIQNAVRHRKPEVVYDERWGSQTRGAVIKLCQEGWARNLLGAMKGARYLYYIGRVGSKPSQRKYLWGWMRRCA